MIAMRGRAPLSLALLSLGAMACGANSRGATPHRAEIVLDSSVVHQTMRGWEAVGQAGQGLREFPLFRDTVLALAADLGLNRVRLEIWSGAENTVDWWSRFQSSNPPDFNWRCVRFATVNDDDDPYHINPAGFQFALLDHRTRSVVLPMRELLARRGERLFVSLVYVAFTHQICPGRGGYHHSSDPEEYAEFALATFQHLRDTYGLVPDAWEMLVEPDENVFDGEQLARSIIATERRLREHGFTPDIIAPSMVRVPLTLPYVDQMSRVPGVWSRVRELSFHRYGGATREQLAAIARRADSLGVAPAMLEHIGSDYRDLHDDLRYGNVAAWSQFTIAFLERDNGGQHIRIDLRDPRHPRVMLSYRSRFLRQYFHYIRMGARRIEARSADSSVDPLAFINADGRWVVIVRADGPSAFSIAGLPPGRYGVTAAVERDVAPPATETAVAAGERLDLRIPARGVMTIAAI
jgi:hypothetical protein